MQFPFDPWRFVKVVVGRVGMCTDNPRYEDIKDSLVNQGMLFSDFYFGPQKPVAGFFVRHNGSCCLSMGGKANRLIRRV